MRSLYEDTKGNLWAGVVDGPWRWKTGPPEFHPVAGVETQIRPRLFQRFNPSVVASHALPFWAVITDPMRALDKP